MTEWPSYAVGPHEHVHALGVITANFNRLEFGLRQLFLLYTRLPTLAGITLFAKLDNGLRASTIRTALNESGHPEHIEEHIAHFLAGYGCSAATRNILMHSTVSTIKMYGSTPENDEDIISFQKSPRDDPAAINVYHPDLKELRSIADSIFDFHRYGLDLWYHILQCHQPFEFRMLPDHLQHKQYALPDKPALPLRLTPEHQ